MTGDLIMGLVLYTVGEEKEKQSSVQSFPCIVVGHVKHGIHTGVNKSIFHCTES